MRALVNRIRHALRRPRFDHDLAEEMETHRSLRQAALEASGLSPEQAAAASRRALGNVTLAREDARHVWILRWLDDAAADLRYAVRTLRRSRSLALTAILTLSLGIGATTAVFSVIDAIVLAPLPVREPERLVVIEAVGKDGESRNASYAHFESLRAPDGVLEGVFAALDGTYRLEVGAAGRAERPEPVRVAAVSGEYFEVLGVTMALGRALTRGDDSGHARVAVIGQRFWQRRFGGDSAILGQRLTMKRESLAIVGVAPEGFFGEAVGRAPDVWVPLTLQPALDPPALLGDPSTGWLRMMGRLRSGVTPVAARAALNARLQQQRAEPGPLGQMLAHVGWMAVEPGARGLPDTRAQLSRQLWIVMAAASVMLIVACGNVASLLLVRATARSRETAIRLAVGAGRGRLVRQFLTEGALLGALGATGGSLIAVWGSHALVRLASDQTAPLSIELAPNVRLLMFGVLTTLAVVVGFSLVPAVMATRRSGPGLAPRERYSRAPLARAFVGGQIALSLVLLCTAGLFLQTLRNLRTSDLGFASGEIVQASLHLPQAGDPRARFAEIGPRIVNRLSTTPGITAVTLSTSGFRTGMSRTCCLAVPGYLPKAGEDRQVDTVGVTPGYFQAMGVPLLEGRAFEPSDLDGARRVVIVNAALVRRYFAGASPTGRKLGWGNPPDVAYDMEIVGIAGDVVYGDLRHRPRPLLYSPTVGARQVMMRTALPLSTIAATVREEARRVEPTLEVDVRSVSEVVEQSLTLERMLARLASTFGGVALLLACIGLYGVMAYGVTRRTREIAVRMALGARRATVVRLVVLEALTLIVAGAAAGAVAAWLSTRLVSNILFGVSPADPLSLGLAAALLLLVGGAAVVVPARRAATVQPILALRHE